MAKLAPTYHPMGSPPRRMHTINDPDIVTTEKLEDIVVAQTERIDQLELDVSRLEEIVEALTDSVFTGYQGSDWKREQEGNLADKFPDKWKQWLRDNHYVEGRGLIKIENAQAQLDRRIQLLMASGQTREDALKDAICIDLMEMLENQNGE